ncbi:serine protease FAM111A [Lates calcarifer]|uniref:Serine protease FAM111A n=2 Tax=Lates calcarifer TaxID=8187 RepID=A0AAJ7QM82_LATCA|nr:serine protease FAM111A [Lates calcarifer]
MPPKKRPTKDIRSFFKKTNDDPGSSSSTSTQRTPGGATASQTSIGCQGKVKEENGCDATGGHLHRFTVKFSRNDCKEYTIDCDQPCTVLEAIKSNEKYMRMMKCANENIVIQLGKEDRKSIVATHFPCSCIREDECLIISQKPEKIEAAQGQHYKVIHPRGKYSVFYIDKEGGVHTKTKELFRSNAVKQFKYLCVYGEKGTTVEEALKRDGRFIDDLGKFKLSDNENPNVLTECTQKVDNLDQKAFKICLPLNKRVGDEKQQENSGASNNLQQEREMRRISDVAKQSGVSVKTALEKSGSSNTKKIYELLRQQFPDLKKWMEERFTGDSYQEELKLRKENFGKIQQSFSEVHRVRKLLKLGESVCKIVVKDVCEGTGFVLFDNFILTNAHLFKGHVNERKFQVDTDVLALFDYEEPEPDINYYYFTCEKTLIDLDVELDYAVIELNPEGQRPNKKTTKKIKVPPGLLEKFGPVPKSGDKDSEACIIGHPAGGVKKMDPTFITAIQRREQAVNDHLHLYKDTLFIVQSITELITRQGIENIMMGGNKADSVVTYNTFMYHGSSGSPVFDALGRVFGLHSAGYTYGFPQHTKSVIEFAHPLLTIFDRFVSNLKEKGDEKLLEKVEEKAKKNQYLKEILEADEPMDTN